MRCPCKPVTHSVFFVAGVAVDSDADSARLAATVSSTDCRDSTSMDSTVFGMLGMSTSEEVPIGVSKLSSLIFGGPSADCSGLSVVEVITETDVPLGST